MRAAERKQFISEHLDKIRDRLLFLAEHMPDTWDVARILAVIEQEVRWASPWDYDREFRDARTISGKRFRAEVCALAELAPERKREAPMTADLKRLRAETDRILTEPAMTADLKRLRAETDRILTELSHELPPHIMRRLDRALARPLNDLLALAQADIALPRV